MDQNLRVAVTGGTSGLGLALVREWRRRGARVAFVARTPRSVEDVARAQQAHGIVGDVARKEDIHPIALQITAALGGLDVLVNNASSLGPAPLALLADTDCEQLELALATNVLGPFRLTKALLGALSAAAREGRGAVVLNVSSDAAINAYAQWGAYGASKAALAQMSAIWTRNCAPRACVSCRSIPVTWTRRSMRLRCPRPIARRSSVPRRRRASSWTPLRPRLPRSTHDRGERAGSAPARRAPARHRRRRRCHAHGARRMDRPAAGRGPG